MAKRGDEVNIETSNLEIERPDYVFLQAELDAARMKWKVVDVREYTFDLMFTSNHELGGIITHMTVVDGVRSIRGYRAYGTERTSASSWAREDTIDELFDEINDLIADRVWWIDIEYDQLLGHPLRISVDRRWIVLDDNYDLRVTNLVIVR